MKFLAIFLWFACGFVAVGINNANLTRIFPSLYSGHDCYRQYRQDMSLSIVLGLTGPVSLIASLAMSGFAMDGWTLLPPEGCEK